MKYPPPPISLLIMLAFTISCSFEYEQLLTDDQKQEIPDVSLYTISERVYDEGEQILELRSDRVQVFEKQGIHKIMGLSFTHFDDDGDIAVRGSSGFASRDLNNDDILLSETVDIYITENSYRIRGEEFLFSPEQNLIWAAPDIFVELLKDDGTSLQGRGFIADLLLQEIRFENGVRGILIDEEDE